MTKSGRLRGSRGRFVPLQKPAVEAHGAAHGKGHGAARDPAGQRLRPAQCAPYLRRELASSFRGIVRGFVKQAETGSVPHFKLTTELLQEQGKRRQQKGSAQKLLEELQRMDPGVRDEG